MTADEARLFSRLGYEDLGYETESEFTHAIQQIRDYLRWAIEEKEFLRKRQCPNISADNTKGLAVIGRIAKLTIDEAEKLKNLNAEVRGKYEIKTFDDILAEIKTIFQNLKKISEGEE